MFSSLFLLYIISTHSLTKRLTLCSPAVPQTYWNFNSQPHEEADALLSSWSLYWFRFQLTASRRGWRYANLIRSSFMVFQLTASRRGWRKRSRFGSKFPYISTHSLTKRLTISYPEFFNELYISTHSLTKRLTKRLTMIIPTTIMNEFIISTHSLTKRLT